jgi:hypothetical protein
MEVGYNYPWASNKFGSWIGPQGRQDHWPRDYAQQWKDLPFRDSIKRNLKILHDHGISVVRWFLLGNGFNYGLPPTSLQFFSRDGQHSLVSDTHWSFEPPEKLDDLFLNHFTQLLEIHSKEKMKLIPSLVGFEFFATHETRGTAAGGRTDVATDPQKRNKFLFTVLGEFLRVSLPYKETIYAWEVINEPAWDVRKITPKQTGYVPHDQWVDNRSLNTFISLSLDWIKHKGFESTVGHRFRSDLLNMPTGTKPQFHYYAEHWGDYSDPNQLPRADQVSGAFLGEIGSVVGAGFESNETPNKQIYGQPWKNEFRDGRDQDPQKVVYERLIHAKNQGYSLAMLWPELRDDNVDSADGIKITLQKLAQVKRFIDSK